MILTPPDKIFSTISNRSSLGSVIEYKLFSLINVSKSFRRWASNNSISKEIKTSLKEKIMGSNLSPKKSFKKQNFTSNGALNDLLNETAMGDTNLESGNSPVSLSEPFTKEKPISMDTTGMPKEVANAVTRDYSDLMGAILNKKK